MNKRLLRKVKCKKELSTTLFLFVLFMFFIILISTVLSVGVGFYLIHLNILPPVTQTAFPISFLFVLLSSVCVGTLLAVVGGNFFIRPLRTLTQATKKVAAGDFDVRVDIHATNEMRQLADSFNEMTKALASIETLRTDFVHTISHEFKTPIVSIKGFARQLKKQGISDAQTAEYLDIIIAEADRLAQLSTNVLLLSNLENTPFLIAKNRFYLDEQIRKTLLLLEPQLLQKQMDLQLEIDTIQIDANEEMTHHVWMNLFHNAIKFSVDKGTMTVYLRKQDSYAVVTVMDTGIGMDDATKAHVFEKFYQADVSRGTAGNGLGLSLVKRILDLCNGKIEIQSAPQKGTTVVVWLPLK